MAQAYPKTGMAGVSQGLRWDPNEGMGKGQNPNRDIGLGWGIPMPKPDPDMGVNMGKAHDARGTV